MFEYFDSYFVHTFFSYNSCFTISLSFQLFLASSYQPVITLYLTTSPFSLSLFLAMSVLCSLSIFLHSSFNLFPLLIFSFLFFSLFHSVFLFFLSFLIFSSLNRFITLTEQYFSLCVSNSRVLFSSLQIPFQSFRS